MMYLCNSIWGSHSQNRLASKTTPGPSQVAANQLHCFKAVIALMWLQPKYKVFTPCIFIVRCHCPLIVRTSCLDQEIVAPPSSPYYDLKPPSIIIRPYALDAHWIRTVGLWTNVWTFIPPSGMLRAMWLAMAMWRLTKELLNYLRIA
jgi:hypothetical protein